MTVTLIWPGNASRARSFRRSRSTDLDGSQIVDPVLLDVDADLAPPVHGVRFGDAAEAAGDPLEILERPGSSRRSAGARRAGAPDMASAAATR